MGDTTLRVILELLVMSAIGMWTWSLRRDWLIFTRRARRVSVCIFVLLLANAYGILHAITDGRPVTSGTWVLLASYLMLNGAMIFAPTNDATTDRQYVDLLRRWRLHR